MKFCCPKCMKNVKLSVEQIQKPECDITCPNCQEKIVLKNNVPVVEKN